MLRTLRCFLINKTRLIKVPVSVVIIICLAVVLEEAEGCGGTHTCYVCGPIQVVTQLNVDSEVWVCVFLSLHTFLYLTNRL